MAFISKVKAKGNIYFYVHIYDKTATRGERSIYSLGSKEKALFKLTSWRKKSYIPGDLIELGIKLENLDKWREKIEAV